MAGISKNQCNKAKLTLMVCYWNKTNNGIVMAIYGNLIVCYILITFLLQYITITNLNNTNSNQNKNEIRILILHQGSPNKVSPDVSSPSTTLRPVLIAVLER